MVTANSPDPMRRCSALLAGKCKNGFPVKRACILIFGIPPCLDESFPVELIGAFNEGKVGSDAGK